MTYLRHVNRLRPTRAMPPALGWLQQEMDRLLESHAGRGSHSGTGDGTGRRTAAWRPPLVAHETELAFEVRLVVPGADPDSLSVSVEGRALTVAGERAGVPDDAVRRLARERSAGSFSRTLELPAPVDAEHVEARYRDGVLLVTLPKAAEARARKIDITFEEQE